MALDPKKFALLTSAIAASIAVVGASATGCTEKAVDDTGDSGDGTSSSSSSSSSSSGSSSGDGGGSSSGDGGGSSSSGDGGGSSSGDGGSCLGDEGAAPTCDDLGAACLAEPGNDYMCPGYAAIFRPEVAKATIDCLKISPSCEEGDPDTNNCAYAAVEQACPVADAASYCDGIIAAANCDDATEADRLREICLGFVPALNQTGRDALTDCASEPDSCGFGLEFCMEPGYVSGTLGAPPED